MCICYGFERLDEDGIFTLMMCKHDVVAAIEQLDLESAHVICIDGVQCDGVDVELADCWLVAW